MFKVGDKVVCPAQGVAEVVGFETRDQSGTPRLFYVLQVLDTDHRIYVPVGDERNIGMRPLVSERDIREVFAILRDRGVTYDGQTRDRLYEGLMDKIRTGSIFDIAEVLRDLYRLRNEKALSSGERHILETARDLIVKEVALAKRETKTVVRREIEAIFAKP